MSAKVIQRVSFIGAGNVALHLAPAMKSRGIGVAEVCNRGEKAGRLLARRTGAVFVADPADMSPETDLFIIAVSDDAIPEVASRLRTRVLTVHTSGSAGLDLLADVSPRTGVFYPLQTFRKGRKIALSQIPFCIEAGLPADAGMLEELGMRLSGKVARLDSGQRRLLHLTAVFSSNFVNHMYAVSQEILDGKGIPFDLLTPLIRQTAGNVRHKDLFSLQTGPAVREDRRIMQMHREMLRDHPRLQEIYELISTNIIHEKNTHGQL